MTLYRYQSDSLIDEVRIATTASRGVRAYLHAAANANPGQLAAMQAKFAAMGWMAVPHVDEKRPVLELRGFQSRRKLFDCLSANGWVQGHPQVTATKDDNTSFGKKLSSLTLKGSGLIYLWGDWGFNKKARLDYRANKSAANKVQIAAAIGYALGSLSLLFYGSRDQSENQIRKATREMKGFLVKESAELPPDAVIHQVTKERDRGFFGNINHFLSRYPSEVMNTIYIGVGLLLAGAAFKKARMPWVGKETLAEFKAERMKSWLDVALGSTTAASALGSVVIKEKKRPEGQPRQKGLAGVWEWIQEKPLRLAGYGYMVATGFHGASYATAMMKGAESHKEAEGGRLQFIITNVVAEFLMAISSKGHGEGIKADGVDETVLATAADLIAKQKPENQQAMIQRLAGFMSSSELLGGKAEKLEATLREQVAIMQNHPWRKSSSALPMIAADPSRPGTQINSAALGTALNSAPTPALGLSV